MNLAAVDPPRRKRLKVVRACTMCRKRKTKCNGNCPCAPCLKTHSTCQYTNTTNTNTKLVQQKQTQPLSDLVSQVTHTTNALNSKLLSTTAISMSSSVSALATNQSPCTIATDLTLSASPQIDTPTGTSGHDIHIPSVATATNAITNNTRARSPIRKPVTYTIQAIEQRLLEIEKTLGLLLQRHYPALPALVLSSPSSCSSSSMSTDASFKTHTKDSMTTSSLTVGTGSSSHNVSQELAFVDHHSPRINLTLPPLQTRPLTHEASSSSSSSSTSSSSGGALLLPYHDSGLLFDRKIPVLQPLLPQHQNQHQQDSKTGPSIMAPPHSPTYHYHHSSLNPIGSPPHPPSCIP